MNRYVSIDAGKFNTKTAVSRANGEMDTIRFRTKMSPAKDHNLAVPEKSHLVTYEGITYKVGEDAADHLSFETSKTTLLHQICAYTAVSSVVDNGDLIRAAIGCPVSVFNDPASRDKYQDFMLNGGRQIQINVDGIDRTFAFDLKNSVVCAESSGLLYLDIGRFAHGTVGIIDIGGLNVNCTVYRDLRPLEESSFTERLGCNQLMSDAKKRLSSVLDMDIPDYLLDDLRIKGYFDGSEEMQKASAEIFSKIKQDWIDAILGKCVEHGWNIKLTALIFAGGTSYYLKPEIERVKAEKKLNIDLDLINEESDFLNAKGFLKRLMMQQSHMK